MFRFIDEQGNPEAVRVVSETEFFNEFKRRPHDPFWHYLLSIQTTIKSKIGLGKPYIFTFKTPFYKKDKEGNIKIAYDGEIEFDFKQFGMNDEKLQRIAPINYCLKMCNKIGYYLLKIHHI